MSLAELLTGIGLSCYMSPLAAQGYTHPDQFSLPEAQLDQVLSSVSIPKGHAVKLKRALRDWKPTETAPRKRPRDEVELSSPTPVPSLVPQKPLVIEVQSLMTSLAVIDRVTEDVMRARDILLSINIPRYRVLLDQLEYIQNTLRAVDEAKESRL